MEKIIGINPVIEVLKSDKNIEKLEVYKKIKKETIKEILNLASKRNIKIFYTDRRTENSQGVVALVSEFDYYVDFAEFLEKLLRKEKSIVVVLDQIQDPRNFGAIIRSAECFGVDGIIIQDRNSVKVTETVVKSSTGAIEHVDIVKVTNISDTIDKLKKYGYTVYGAEADGQNYYYEEKSEGTLRQNCKNTLEGANKLAECVCGWGNNIVRDVKIVRFGIFLFIKNI